MTVRQNKIDTNTKRSRLNPAREPYWWRLAPGKFIGYRKAKAGGGAWIARLGKKQQVIDSTGELPYENATAQAQDWCSRVEGGSDTNYTLADAVDDYVAHLAINNPARTSINTKTWMNGRVPEHLMKQPLHKLTTLQLTRWHASLVRTDGDEEDIRRSKDTANRGWGMIRAALNLAFSKGLVSSDTPWRRVKPFKSVGNARTLFLTPEQVSRLVGAADGNFKALCEAALLTGARPGELAKAQVKDFDAVAGTLHLSGKTGPRSCYLSSAGVKFFKKQGRDSLPNALLLPSDVGRMWFRNVWGLRMKDVRKKAKLPHDTVLYSLRHYHISRALIAGVPMIAIARNCGTSVKMLEQNYAKFTAADRRQMMDTIEL